MGSRCVRAFMACAIFSSYCAGAIGSVTHAEEPRVDLNSPDAIRHVLEQQVGTRVKVKLASGQELEGKVTKTGTHVVVIGELAGMEFFDATVRLDQIAAVVVKVRSK